MAAQSNAPLVTTQAARNGTNGHGAASFTSDSITNTRAMFSQLLAKLQSVKQGRQGYTALCPAHDDRSRSLSLTQTGDGTILLKCFAGCTSQAIADALGIQLRDLFPATHIPPKSEVIAKYDYRDEDGRLLYQALRFMPKGFIQRRPDGAGGWIKNLNGTRRVLYRLPELLATNPDEVVFLVEGEKDADNLARLGLCATTNAAGANNWRDEYAESLRGRHVVIIPDNDDAGYKHAATVAKSIKPLAASVKILELPNLPPKGDVSDWLSAGGNKAQLLELADRVRTETELPTHETFTPRPDDAPDLNQFALTDAGNGEAFALLHGDRVRYDYRRKEWLVWASHYWRIDQDGALQRLAIHTARARLKASADIDGERERGNAARWALQSESLFRRKAMLESAAIVKPIADTGDWDTNDWLIGCNNGILDLREGKLIQPNPAQRITRNTRIDFDMLAECPRWDSFLEEVFVEDELIQFIKRAVGYSLSGDTSEQVVFILHGLGANGKSVFLSILRDLLGDYAANTPFQTFETAERGGTSNDVAALAGVRLVTSSETREAAQLNEARLKSITGGDPITARFLFREYFTFTPKLKLWLAVNHKPKVSDDTFGFWRRVRLVPFVRTFDAQTADPRLIDSLRDELPGIFRWAVEGCIDWQNRGLQPPQIVAQATEAYRNEQDAVGQFIADRCVIADKAMATAADLWEAFKQWRAENDAEQISQTYFGRKLAERGYTKRRATGGHGITQTFYNGIGLLAA